MNVYRKMLIEAVERNGGYYTRWESYPIEYVVGLYYTLGDLDDYADAMINEKTLDPKLWGIIKEDFSDSFDMDDHWHDVQGRMADLDDCAYRTYSPETAAKFGLPYEKFPNKYQRIDKDLAYFPAQKKGWKRVNPYINLEFEVDFTLQGRNGKHLCIAKFDGHTLGGLSNERFIEALEDPDTQFSNEWCRNLLAMMEEWEVCFTPKAASSEFDYLMKDRILQCIEEFVESDDFTPEMYSEYHNLKLELEA